MRRAFAILVGLVVGASVAACGDDPKPVSATVPASDFSDPEAGIAFRAPAGVRVAQGKEDQIVVLRRGQSTLVISRFERKERLPRSTSDFARGARSLKAEYINRLVADGSRLDGVKAVPESVANLKSVDVEAAVIKSNGAALRTRHHHFYEFGAEIVVDQVAPKQDFDRADALLFEPVLDSLKITRPRD